MDVYLALIVIFFTLPFGNFQFKQKKEVGGGEEKKKERKRETY